MKRINYKYTTAKQEGGDDGYCWCVRYKETGKEYVTGCTIGEAREYRKRLENRIRFDRGETLI